MANVLDDSWKQTCSILLRQDIDEVDEYAKYLQRFIEPVKIKKSVISGKDVAICEGYQENTRFILGDEIKQYEEKYGKQKLDINEIKDLDSIVEAMEERVCYAGNIRLGTSSGLEKSNRLIDSNSVYRSSDVFYSRYVGYSNLVRYSEYIFGSMCISKTQFGIKNFETFENMRVMETVRTYLSLDCYYTANLEGCQDCMFSFNLRNKHNCIGNLQLTPHDYKEKREKLLEDIRINLATKKRIPSVLQIVGGICE